MSFNLPFLGQIDWWTIIALLVAWPLAKFTFIVLYEIFKQLLPPVDLVKRYCRPGQETWAVVTGATDGIGLGFCEVLAALGFNIVLISRSKEKLDVTAENLK